MRRLRAAPTALPAAVAVLGAATLLVAAPVALAAQAAEPLTKTELVQLLTGETYSPAEIISIVRRTCMTFEPTTRDLEDFRRLGASEELLRAVEECRAPVRATLRPARVTVRAGGTARVSAAAARAGRPAAGIRLALAGSERITGRRLTSVTDASGRATFQVPVGRVARSYRFRLAAVGAELGDPPALVVEVVPGPAASARLSPSRLATDAERDTAIRVHASVRDAHDNPVPERRLVLRDPSTGEETTATTDELGEAAFLLEVEGLRDGSVLLLASDGELLAELPVEVRTTDFVAAGGEGEAARGEGESPGESRDALEPGEPSDRLESEVLISRGYRELSAGRPEPAATHFRSALERKPENPRALEGLAQALASSGQVVEATAAYERAVAASPEDAELRLALARTLDRAGQREKAERAYAEILERDPDRVTVVQELALLRDQPYLVELSAWGGAILESESSPTLRAGEASLLITRSVRVWGRYDRSLGLEHPPLLRGRDLFEGFFGGIELLWGARRTLATRFEAGRRTDPIADLEENVVRVEQSIRMPAGRSYAGITLGGYLGRWFDRDDWLAYARGRVPVGESVSVDPALFVGETVGTETSVNGRSPEREVRFLLPVAYRHPRGWLVEPGVAIGTVEGETDATTGRLVEARLRAEVPIAGPHRFRVFLLHHSPPAGDSFQAATAGVALRLQ